MLFTSYSSADANSILKMLSDHTDYAPETVPSSEILSDTEYFQDAYINEQHSGYTYVLKEDGGEVKVFATLAKWHEQADVNCWYVTSLFVGNGHNADELALQMISELREVIAEDSLLYINVHPDADFANCFWRSNGFHLSAEKSRYVNSDGDRLTAYTK